jgi:hypothetical protein
MSGPGDAPSLSASRWPPTGRDLVAVVTVIVAVVALIAVGVGLEAAHRAKLAHDRAVAEAAAKAAEPRRAPAITSSVYVRAVPIRRAG